MLPDRPRERVRATRRIGGYFSQALVVDASDGSAAVLPLPEAVLPAYLGGVGLGAWLLHRR